MNRDSVIVMICTFNRTDYAVRTIKAIKAKLKYSGEIYYYLADAGSTEEHYKACLDELGEVWGKHHIYQSPGDNWNLAMNAIFRETDFCLRLEDDFELRRELDITPYVKALKEKENWGIIRLGHLPIDLNCYTVGYDGIHYLMMYRTTQYAYSGNPLIMHKRFWNHYGSYHRDLSPGQTETEYDARFRQKEGLEIVWPVDLGGWGIFAHIGERKSI